MRAALTIHRLGESKEGWEVGRQDFVLPTPRVTLDFNFPRSAQKKPTIAVSVSLYPEESLSLLDKFFWHFLCWIGIVEKALKGRRVIRTSRRHGNYTQSGAGNVAKRRNSESFMGGDQGGVSDVALSVRSWVAEKVPESLECYSIEKMSKEWA